MTTKSPDLSETYINIEIHPVMIPDDLAKAGGAIENAVKKYA